MISLLALVSLMLNLCLVPFAFSAKPLTPLIKVMGVSAAFHLVLVLYLFDLIQRT